MGQILDGYEQYKKDKEENFENVTMKIIEMLLFNEFVFYTSDEKFIRTSTGYYFYLHELEKYKSVLDFQIKFPYYSICGN